MHTDSFLLPDAVFDNGQLLPNTVIQVSDGEARKVSNVPKQATIKKITGIITPGLIDLQVNGGGGVLFNSSPSPEGISAILAAHRHFGTTWLLPTVITDMPEVTEAAVVAVQRAWGMQGLLGIHIEGPHISTVKRGTHDARYIRALDQHTIKLIEGLRDAAIPVILTLAPEAATAKQIRTLSNMGAIVSLGHSNATASEVEVALNAGACNFTHLFNGMSPMEGRAPGMVGSALLSKADIGIICDGVHVSDAMVRLAIQAHGAEAMHLVSDAMPTVGGPDVFELYGSDIYVSHGAEGTRLVNADGGLAGAHTTMAEGVLRLVRNADLPLEQALKLAISNPARIVGANHLGSIYGQRLQSLLLWQQGDLPQLLSAENSALTR